MEEKGDGVKVNLGRIWRRGEMGRRSGRDGAEGRGEGQGQGRRRGAKDLKI